MINNKKEFMVLAGIIATVMVGYNMFSAEVRQQDRSPGERARAKAEIRRQAQAEINEQGTPSDLAPRTTNGIVGSIKSLWKGDIFAKVDNRKVEFQRPGAALQNYSGSKPAVAVKKPRRGGNATPAKEHPVAAAATNSTHPQQPAAAAAPARTSEPADFYKDGNRP